MFATVIGGRFSSLADKVKHWSRNITVADAENYRILTGEAVLNWVGMEASARPRLMTIPYSDVLTELVIDDSHQARALLFPSSKEELNFWSTWIAASRNASHRSVDDCYARLWIDGGYGEFTQGKIRSAGRFRDAPWRKESPIFVFVNEDLNGFRLAGKGVGGCFSGTEFGDLFSYLKDGVLEDDGRPLLILPSRSNIPFMDPRGVPYGPNHPEWSTLDRPRIREFAERLRIHGDHRKIIYPKHSVKLNVGADYTDDNKIESALYFPVSSESLLKESVDDFAVL